jgi:hypothetical protein
MAMTCSIRPCQFHLPREDGISRSGVRIAHTLRMWSKFVRPALQGSIGEHHSHSRHQEEQQSPWSYSMGTYVVQSVHPLREVIGIFFYL